MLLKAQFTLHCCFLSEEDNSPFHLNDITLGGYQGEMEADVCLALTIRNQ